MSKRLHFLALAGFGITLAQAQPTLTLSTNGLMPGQTYTRYYTEYDAPGAGGGQVTWDLSHLDGLEEEQAFCMAPSSHPDGGEFPGATVTRADLFTDQFYRLQTNGQWNVGRAGEGIVIPFTDHKLELPFPCTFGTEWADDFEGSYMDEGQEWFLSGQINGVADGYGTLVMPYGTVNNVLRVHTVDVEMETDGESEYFGIAEVFSYYAVGTPWPLVRLVQITWIFFEEPIEFGYTEWAAPLATGIADDRAPMSMRVWPNPASDATRVMLPEGAGLILEVFDATGRRMQRAEGLRGGAEHLMDLRGYAPGAYSAVVTDTEGARSSVRFVVQ